MHNKCLLIEGMKYTFFSVQYLPWGWHALQWHMCLPTIQSMKPPVCACFCVSSMVSVHGLRASAARGLFGMGALHVLENPQYHPRIIHDRPGFLSNTHHVKTGRLWGGQRLAVAASFSCLGSGQIASVCFAILHQGPSPPHHGSPASSCFVPHSMTEAGQAWTFWI